MNHRKINPNKLVPFGTNLENVRANRVDPKKYREEVIRGSKILTSQTFSSLTRGAPINGLDITLQTSAVQLSIASNNANDTSAGTGLTLVRIRGVDSNWDEITEDISLNGQTPVITTKTFRGVNELIGLTAGATGYNEGDISVSFSGETFTAGEPDTTLYACIEAEWSSSNLGFHYTINNFHYIPINYITNSSSTLNNQIEAEVFIQPLGLARQKIALQSFVTSVNYELKAMPVVPPKSVVYINARNTSASSNNFTIWFQFLKIKNFEVLP